MGLSCRGTMHGKEPLYRRVNTRTRGVRHGGGGEYRWSRRAKREDPTTRGSMHGGQRHGLDYTPLFRFLLSRVGEDWAETYREATSRLDRPDPVFWIVARSEEEARPVVILGENSYFSGLRVDAEGRLALVDPSVRIEDLKPSCACCTHTFNGKPFVRKFAGR